MTTQLLLMGCRTMNNSFVTKISLAAGLIIFCHTLLGFEKVISGGPGTDTLNINLSINLEDFVSLTYDGGTSTDGTFTLVPVSGSSVAFTAVETLSVNGVSWEIIYSGGGYGARGDVLDGAYSKSAIFYSASNDKIVGFDNGSFTNCLI